MARKKEQSVTVENEHSHLVFSHGIKIYPVAVNGRFYIEVDNNGRIKRYDKHLTQKEVNDALANTILYFYKKIIDSKTN